MSFVISTATAPPIVLPLAIVYGRKDVPMQPSMYSLPRQRIFPMFVVALLCSSLFLLSAPVLTSVRTQHTGAQARFAAGRHYAEWVGAAPPDNASCMAARHHPCYSPQEMQNAYSLTPVLQAGYTGKGQTIVIIDSFGSPTAAADLKKFDTDYGLPDPPSFRALAPLGSVPFDPNNADMVGWAEETSLDVQWAHAMAPGASIVLLTSPVSETEGVQGMPQFLALEVYALEHNLGKIISQSWAATENTLFTAEGRKVLDSFNAFYLYAALRHVTVFASSGDSGVANPDVNGNIYPFPTVGFPASSPWVTAVGGTSLYADANGNYQSETTWNDTHGATGGGVSQYFREPDYQEDNLPQVDRTLLKHHRGLPDIAYNADPATSVPVYLGFRAQPGYALFGGTSEGSPQWAGLIADANQMAGHPLGFLNSKLYRLGSHKAAEVFHDITTGNNTQDNIPGYTATAGWDAATGWGSPIADKLFAALE